MSEHLKPCCAAKIQSEDKMTDAHGNDHSHKEKKIDYLYVCCIGIALISVMLHIAVSNHLPTWLNKFTATTVEILATMWWGIALGIIVVGLMGKIPRTYFTGVMGKDDSFSGLVRAVIVGFFMDLCCHGILLVASKLYERGVSLPQVIAFMVSSPWNSFSLTIVLVAMIGLKWTILYICGSILIALTTGYLLQILTRINYIPSNPNTGEAQKDFNFYRETISLVKNIRFSKSGLYQVLSDGWQDGQMIIKWLLFGTLIAAMSRTFIPHDVFSGWFGPTIIGLLLTLAVATVVEICSHGSAPIASEFVRQAGAPGNGFAFLMAGVATDYAEIMSVKEFTKSWKIAILLPVVTVPQILFIAWLMNLHGL